MNTLDWKTVYFAACALAGLIGGLYSIAPGIWENLKAKIATAPDPAPGAGAKQLHEQQVEKPARRSPDIPEGVLSIEEDFDHVTLRTKDQETSASYASLPIALPLWLKGTNKVVISGSLSGLLAALLNANGVTIVYEGDVGDGAAVDCEARKTRFVILTGDSDKLTQHLYHGQNIEHLKRILRPLAARAEGRVVIAAGLRKLRETVRNSLKAREHVVIIFNNTRSTASFLERRYLGDSRITAISCNTFQLEHAQHRTTRELDLESVVSAALRLSQFTGEKLCLDDVIGRFASKYNSLERMRTTKTAAILVTGAGVFGGSVYGAIHFAQTSDAQKEKVRQ